MKELLLKAALSGGIAGVASNLLYGDGNVDLFGMTTKASYGVGIAVASGSLVSDYVSDNIIENMDVPQNVKSLEELAVRGGVCGAASSAVMLATGMPVANLGPSFILGGASKLGGDYTYEKAFGEKGFLPIF